MEDKPLVVLVFSQIIGLVESNVDLQDRKKLNWKLYLKKGLVKFLKDILELYQVTLFLDL